MSFAHRTAVLATALLLSACAATVSRPAGQAAVQSTAPVRDVALQITAPPAIQASSDWRAFQAEWRTAFEAAATAKGLRASYVEGAAANPEPGTVLVKVNVNDYRYITPAARFGLGIMSGNAYIDANAQYIQYPDAKVIGDRKFSTSSSAWQGVFSAMTDKQVRAISDEIVTDLSSR